ncbi:hypothetical protein AB5N19_04772 [Seiridium cardinale]
MAGELFDVTHNLWGETENITYQGKVNPWSLVNALVTPKPLYGRPILANAAGSPLALNSQQGAYDSHAHAWRGRKYPLHKQRHNLGGNIEVIGSPEQVVEPLKALHELGIDGVHLNFYDFANDLEYFGHKILSLLKEAGLHIDWNSGNLNTNKLATK